MIDAFGVLFWPGVLLEFLIFALLYHKRIPKRWVNPMGCLAIALVALPIFALSYLFYNSSQLVIFDQWSMFIVTGFLVLWGLPTLANTRRTRSVMSIFALAAISVGTWLLVGDFLFSRRETEGVVETMNKTRGIAPSYRVYIGGHRYNMTASLLDSLVVGARVRIEIGVGSGTIFEQRMLVKVG
jgi:hypothetical protein